MPSAFGEFERTVRELGPETAVVLGSGLGGVTTQFRESASIPFGDIPGLVPTTIHGHRGRLAVGLWNEAPALIFFGRLHYYEGHSPEVVTGTVRAAANLGAKRLVLTNAAGGVHPALAPGALMVIRGHIKLIGREAWRALPANTGVAEPYSLKLIHAMRDREAADGRTLPVGIYAALTGPSYETPAEIRALAACGADAVGMSTALEAEAAAELRLEIAAISCITNKAAGLSAGALDHTEVLANAKLAVARMGELLGRLV
jgi:purine-nucleoside phosphorylase